MGRWNLIGAQIAGAVSVALLGGPALAGAEVQVYFDRDQWFSGAQDVTTLDFTGFTEGDFITDQYSHLGVNFPDGNDVIIGPNNSYPNDGFGLHGALFDGITLEFDAPQRAIAVDFPGDLLIELYDGGQLVYESSNYGGGGSGFFVGFFCQFYFDAAIIYGTPTVYVDDIHFAAVPAPGTLSVISLLFLSQRRRWR